MDQQTTFLYTPRPWLIALFVLCWAGCTAVAFGYGPDEWSMLRKLFAGFVLGAWCFLCLFINRVLISD